MSNTITHYCGGSGRTVEIKGGTWLPDAQEYRATCPECGGIVYHNGEIEHE